MTVKGIITAVLQKAENSTFFKRLETASIEFEFGKIHC